MKTYKKKKEELKNYLISHDVRDDEWWQVHREFLDLCWYGKADYYITAIITKITKHGA